MLGPPIKETAVLHWNVKASWLVVAAAVAIAAVSGFASMFVGIFW